MSKKAKQTRYKWRDGFRCSVDADTAAKALDSIRSANGRLSADDVVEQSRPEDAPLHPAFEWDDAKAATNYRRQQAQTIIRAVVVVERDEQPEHRAYTLVRDDGSGKASYEATEVVVQNADLFADAVRRLMSEVVAAKNSVDELERLAQTQSTDTERMARIALAAKALEAASAAVAALH